jgi:hypothetical protein
MLPFKDIYTVAKIGEKSEPRTLLHYEPKRTRGGNMHALLSRNQLGEWKHFNTQLMISNLKMKN